VTVGMIVEAIAAGRSVPDLLNDFPYLEEADIRGAGLCREPRSGTRGSSGQLNDAAANRHESGPTLGSVALYRRA